MLKVVSYEYLEETDVYDLWIDDYNHSFYCQDIPVHNSSWCREHDGKKYDTLEDINKDLNHHFNCRSVHLALTGFELVDKRASQFGAADRGENYRSWFDKQSESFKKSTLSNRKYKDYLEGKARINGLGDLDRKTTLDSATKTIEKLL